MRQSNFTVFDEYLPKQGSTGSAGSVFTGTQFNAQLAKNNQLGIHAVFDNITIGTIARNLYCFVEESSDGRNWIQRSNTANSYASGDADIALAVSTTATLLQALWSDSAMGVSKGTTATSNTGPFLGFVRLRMFFDQTDVGGHFHVTATQRDY